MKRNIWSDIGEALIVGASLAAVIGVTYWTASLFKAFLESLFTV